MNAPADKSHPGQPTAGDDPVGSTPPSGDLPDHDAADRHRADPAGPNAHGGDSIDAVDAALESAAEHHPPPTRDEQLEQMRLQVEQAQQRVLMAQAEMENFRRRTRKDFEDQLRFANMPLIEDLLQVRDNLQRAIEAAGSTHQSQGGLVAGVEMVARQLDDVMAKHHVKPIAALGQPFDPNYHQAIAQAPSDEYEAGIVSVEAATGFEMHGRVVRPSQVVVSTGKADS